MEKRTLRIKNKDSKHSKDLNISKAVVVHSEKEFIYWEKNSNGDWQLTFSSSVISDFSEIDSFEIIRES